MDKSEEGEGVIGWGRVGELIQSSEIKKQSLGRGGTWDRPTTYGWHMSGCNHAGGREASKRDPLVLPGLMGIQLGCNWPIPPQAEGATYFPIHNHSLYYS